jgi:hypothetical protein
VSERATGRQATLASRISVLVVIPSCMQIALSVRGQHVDNLAGSVTQNVTFRGKPFMSASDTTSEGRPLRSINN